MGLHDIASRLDRAVARKLGERFELIPMLRGHMDNAPDETRVGGEFVGHLFLEKEQGEFDAKFNRRAAITGAVLKVGVEELPDGATIQINDEIIALERGDVRFRVNQAPLKLGQYVVDMGAME
jgi:hypothetical protein